MISGINSNGGAKPPSTRRARTDFSKPFLLTKKNIRSFLLRCKTGECNGLFAYHPAPRSLAIADLDAAPNDYHHIDLVEHFFGKKNTDKVVAGTLIKSVDDKGEFMIFKFAGYSGHFKETTDANLLKVKNHFTGFLDDIGVKYTFWYFKKGKVPVYFVKIALSDIG